MPQKWPGMGELSGETSCGPSQACLVPTPILSSDNSLGFAGIFPQNCFSLLWFPEKALSLSPSEGKSSWPRVTGLILFPSPQ